MKDTGRNAIGACVPIFIYAIAGIRLLQDLSANGDKDATSHIAAEARSVQGWSATLSAADAWLPRPSSPKIGCRRRCFST